jgi:shikimate dehydrogenase
MGLKLKKAAVVGWPIKHSKSPLIHGYWIKQFGINGSYTAIGLPPEKFASGIHDLMSKGYRGCNVTIPHKESALTIADFITDRAKAIGAANTLVFEDGKIHADNTDGVGFINNLKQNAPQWAGSNGAALVLGAGGAARAIIYALLKEKVPKVIIVNRTEEKALQLATFFGDKVTTVSIDNSKSILGDIRTLVNTTSLGMVGQPDLEIDISCLPKNALVTDIVYNPLKTNLLSQAQELGLETVDGLGMLLHQAVPGFEAWFGVRPTVDRPLRQIVLAS